MFAVVLIGSQVSLPASTLITFTLFKGVRVRESSALETAVISMQHQNFSLSAWIGIQSIYIFILPLFICHSYSSYIYTHVWKSRDFSNKFNFPSRLLICFSLLETCWCNLVATAAWLSSKDIAACSLSALNGIKHLFCTRICWFVMNPVRKALRLCKVSILISFIKDNTTQKEQS